MGFSAGGHLASTLATHFDDGDPSATDAIDRMSSRPDVAILGYPVVSMEDPIAHVRSRQNLLGDAPSPELVELLSNEKQVTSRTPPVFIFQTNEDSGVVAENSLRLVAALRKAGVPVEMHLFEKGKHGVGLAQDDPALKLWPTLLENWLRVNSFLRTPVQ
jgi:acetyl esterase/lipase